MQQRKPRFARYELERMSIKELVELNRGRALGIGEKKDLIQFLIDNERIDLIPTPEPVEHKMEALRTMRVSELKRAMENAGVFFHAKDVVEKSDMISIFVNSGRLNVIPEDDNFDPEAATKDFSPITREGSCKSKETSLPSKRPLVETVSEDECSEIESSSTDNEALLNPVVMFPSEASPVPPGTALPLETQFEVTPRTSMSALSDEMSMAPNVVDHMEQSSDAMHFVEGSAEAPSLDRNTRTSAGQGGFASTGDGCIDSANSSLEPQLSTEPQGSTDLSDGSGDIRNHPQLSNSPLTEYSESQLSSLGHDATINLPAGIERCETGSTLVDDGVNGRARMDLLPSSFADWSVSQLRAVASEVNVDLSNCTDQTAIIDRIVKEANSERPHIRDYLRVLSPLTTSSISQLRSTAQAWDVDISDCLEKEEIIQRLITRANQFGVC